MRLVIHCITKHTPALGLPFGVGLQHPSIKVCEVLFGNVSFSFSSPSGAWHFSFLDAWRITNGMQGNARVNEDVSAVSRWVSTALAFWRSVDSFPFDSTSARGVYWRCSREL